MGLPNSAKLFIYVFQKIVALLSVLGTAMIISAVFRSEKNRKNTQQRIVGLMSVVDIFAAFTWLTTHLWIPKDYPDFAGIGNKYTCRTQGFLIQLTTISILYNACLSIYYMLLIKYNWKSHQLVRIEKWFHLVTITFGVGTSIAVLCLDLFHPSNWNCFIGPDYTKNPDPRADLAKTLVLLFAYIPIWIAASISIVCMTLVYFHVKKIEARAKQWVSLTSQMKQTKEIFVQGILYVSVFIVTYIFASCVRFTQFFGKRPPVWLIVLAGSLIPSQGFMNALVYFRLRVHRKMKQNPGSTRTKVILEIMRSNLVPCCHPYLKAAEEDDRERIRNTTTSRKSASNIEGLPANEDENNL